MYIIYYITYLIPGYVAKIIAPQILSDIRYKNKYCYNTYGYVYFNYYFYLFFFITMCVKFLIGKNHYLNTLE